MKNLPKEFIATLGGLALLTVLQQSFVDAFKKDETIKIPININYESFSGLSNEVKSKLNKIRPRTLGQALRIDGITPAAALIILGFIKKAKYRSLVNE